MSKTKSKSGTAFLYVHKVGCLYQGYDNFDIWNFMYRFLNDVDRQLWNALQFHNDKGTAKWYEKVHTLLNRMAREESDFYLDYDYVDEGMMDWPNSQVCRRGITAMRRMIRSMAGPYTYFGGHNSKGGNKFTGFWIDHEAIELAHKEGRVIRLVIADYITPLDWWPSDELRERIEADCRPEFVFLSNGYGCYWLYTPAVEFNDAELVWSYTG